MGTLEIGIIVEIQTKGPRASVSSSCPFEMRRKSSQREGSFSKPLLLPLLLKHVVWHVSISALNETASTSQFSISNRVTMQE